MIIDILDYEYPPTFQEQLDSVVDEEVQAWNQFVLQECEGVIADFSYTSDSNPIGFCEFADLGNDSFYLTVG